MKIKKSAKILVALAAGASLIVTLINDNKSDNKSK